MNRESLIRTNTYLYRDEQILQSVHRQLKDASDFLLNHLKSDSETGLIEEVIVTPKARKTSKKVIVTCTSKNKSKGEKNSMKG